MCADLIGNLLKHCSLTMYIKVSKQCFACVDVVAVCKSKCYNDWVVFVGSCSWEANSK